MPKLKPKPPVKSPTPGCGYCGLIKHCHPKMPDAECVAHCPRHGYNGRAGSLATNDRGSPFYALGLLTCPRCGKINPYYAADLSLNVCRCGWCWGDETGGVEKKQTESRVEQINRYERELAENILKFPTPERSRKREREAPEPAAPPGPPPPPPVVAARVLFGRAADPASQTILAVPLAAPRQVAAAAKPAPKAPPAAANSPKITASLPIAARVAFGRRLK